MILLTLKEMDIKRQIWVRDFLPEHKFLGSRGNIAWPHENFYVSNVNENYFSEFLAFVPDEGLHKAEINCTESLVDVIHNRQKL